MTQPKPPAAPGIAPHLVLLVGAAALATGCPIKLAGDCGGGTPDGTYIACATNGDARATSPTFTLPEAVGLVGGQSCLKSDGTCRGDATVQFRSPEVSGRAHLQFTLHIASGDATGTVPLLGGTPHVQEASIDNKIFSSDLIVTAGTLTVTRNDPKGGVAGTFAIEMDSVDGGHHISVTDGRFDVGPCAVSISVCAAPAPPAHSPVAVSTAGPHSPLRDPAPIPRISPIVLSTLLSML